MVHQHFMLVETLSALDNVMLGAESHWSLRKAQIRARDDLQALMQSTGLQVDLDATVSALSVGQRQRLEILKALYKGARVLLLDEPTAVLTPGETQDLFAVLRTLRDQGSTIVLITHKLKEVMQLCDHVSVMRAGSVVHEVPIAQAHMETLAEMMVGRTVRLERQDHGTESTGSSVPASTAKLVLQAQGLTLQSPGAVPRVHTVDLRLCAGEIVGVAGVSGNGQSELLEMLAGMRAPTAGTLRVGDAHFDAANWLDPGQARALGLAHVPEDRQARALVMEFAVWEAMAMGYDHRAPHSRGPWMQHRAMREHTATLQARFDVRPRNPLLPCAAFSGGNQQKMVLARELDQGPAVLLVGQPTRGVDIGAIEFIYAQLRALRDAGCAVLVVSSELDEILALADRVVVMTGGRLSPSMPVGECTEARLGALMAGVA
jgi:simple sugar transport system ATP-binding protein